MASDSTTNTQSQIVHSVLASNTTIADEYANNPFFLPANENLGLMLTSQPLTGPNNYMSWARSFGSKFQKQVWFYGWIDC